MILLVLAFTGIFLLERKYLKNRKADKRTHAVVFSVMGVAFAYNASIVLFPELPSPNLVIITLLGPLQHMLLGY
jgi:hypothetical protein